MQHEDEELQVAHADCVFFLKSIQSHALKSTIEALKDILIDVSVYVSEEGLKICSLSVHFRPFVCHSVCLIRNELMYYEICARNGLQ